MNMTNNRLHHLVDTRVPREPTDPLVMHRQRVTDLLEQAANAPLLIVRGPVLCGKSVGLQHWSNSTTKSLLWLHLSVDEQQPEQFWAKVQMAILIRLGLQIPLDHDAVHGSPARLLAALVHGAAPFTLIIEDYHWVIPEYRPGVETELLELLDYAPEISVVVVARSPLSIEPLRLTSRVEMSLVDRADLAFDAHEAKAYHAGTVLEIASADVNEQLLGSPVLHKAAHRVATESQTPTVPLLEDVVERVSEVLHSEIAAIHGEWISPSTEAFMAATLPLQEFDLPLAQAVAPGIDVLEAIRELSESGLLWTETTPTSTLHSYRTFIAKAFSTIVEEQLAATRSRTLSTAAVAEFKRRRYFPAFAYAVANADYRLASSMLVCSGLDPMYQGGQKFASVMSKIPQTQIIRYPLLCLAAGVTNVAHRRTRFKAMEYFALALASGKLQGKSLPAEENLALNLAQSVALRMTGQFKLAAARSRRSLKDLAELPLTTHDDLGLFKSHALGHWGLSLLFTADFTAATKALHQGAALGGQFKVPQAAFFALSLLAYRYALDGDLTTAADYAASAKAAQPDMPAVELYQLTPLAMALALIELGRLNPDGAAEHLAPVISETATSEFWGQLRVIESRIELLRGHAGIALGRLDLALLGRNELPALNPVDAVELDSMQAELLMAAGNATGALAALARLPAKSPARTVARARMSLGMCQYGEVLELLGGTLKFTTVRQALEAQVLLTVARLALQPAEVVRPDIERISSSIATLGNHWPLAMLSDTELELLLSSARKLGVPWPQPPAPLRGLLPPSLSLIALTPREQSILATLADTGDRAEIARTHSVSLNTVKSQLRTLYKKLGVTSREEALLVAHREHLF